jgi:hypothetical protein
MLIFHNKIVLVANVNELCKMLQSPHVVPPLRPCIYGDRIAIKHSMTRNTHVVRIWKTRSFLDIWYDEFSSSSSQFIAAIDYKVRPDHLKIEYMNINDGFCSSGVDGITVSSMESCQLNTALIAWMRVTAREESKSKIIVDVHHNLRIFDKYYDHNRMFDLVPFAKIYPRKVRKGRRGIAIANLILRFQRLFVWFVIIAIMKGLFVVLLGELDTLPVMIDAATVLLNSSMPQRRQRCIIQPVVK